MTDVERRARLYGMAPIRHMVKRGWLRATKDIDDLERQVVAFFGMASIDDEIPDPLACVCTREPELRK